MSVRISDSSGLVWDATINDAELNSVADRIERKVLGMSNNVVSEGNKIDGMFKNLAAGAAAFFTAQQGAQLVNSIISVRGEFQQLEIAFTTMLQSKEKADKLMQEAVTLAATTPFGLQDVAGGAKQLLAYGFAAEDITDNITRLGNIASGVGSQLGDLIYLYGTLKASGRVTQMDINQFAGRGIPIYDALSKVLGTTVDKVRDMVSAGQVGFPQIEKAFQNLTNQGGMFYNLMEEQSKSLTGQISNLQDTISQMFNEIGQSNEGLLSDGISGIAYLVEHYKEIGNILGVLITTYGAYRAALILTAAIEKARYLTTLQLGAADGAITISTALRTQATNILTAAQARLNAVMAANPYIAIATAVAALASAYYFLGDRTSAAERAQKAYNEALSEVKSGTQDLAGKSRELLSVLNDDTQTRANQIIAFKDLNTLYKGRLTNLDLESFKLQTVEERQRAVNAALSDYTVEALRAQRAQAQDVIAKKGFEQQVWYKEIGELLNDIITLEDSQAKRVEEAVELEKLLTQEIGRQEDARKLAAMTDAERLEYAKKQLVPLEMQLKSWESTNGELKRNKDGLIETDNLLAKLTIQPVLNQYNQWLGLINGVNSALNGLPKIRTLNDIDEDIKNTKDAQKGTSSNKSSFDFRTNTYTKGFAEYDKDIEKLEAEKRAITGELSEEQKKAHKEQESAAKKIATTVKQSAEEQKRAIESVTVTEKQATIDRMVEGEKQVAEIEARYEKMRQTLKDAGVKKGSAVFEKVDKLEQQAKDDNTYKNDTEAIKKYLDEQKDLYQQFNDFKEKVGVEAAKKEFEGKIQLDKTFTDLINQSLNNHIAAQVGQQANAVNQARELMLRGFQTDNTNSEQKADRDKKAQALIDFATYHQKREAIVNSYNERVKLLGANVTADELAEAERQKKIALGQLADEYADRLTESKTFFNGLVLMSRQAVQGQIKNIQRLLQLSNLDPATKKKLEKDLEDTKKLLKVDPDELELVQLKKQLQEVDQALQKINDNTPESVQRKSELMVQRTNLNSEITEKNLTAIDKALNKLSKAAPAIAVLGDALSSISSDGSGLSELGAGLSTVAGGLGNLVTQIKDKTGASSTDAYVAAAQFAFQLISTIADAAKKRKQAEEEFYINVLGLQNDYNLALIEQHRLQAELSENVFVKDYFGRAKAGMEAAIVAANKYQEALDKLSEGKAKERQKNVVDGKTVGQLALSGAAAGAVIGAAIGGGIFSVPAAVVGAVIGGIVGAIGGLFAKKKKDVYGGLLEQYPELLKKGANGQREINRELAEALIKNNQLDAKTKQLVQNALDQEKAYKAAYDQVRQVVADLAGSLGDDLRNALVSAWKAGEDGVKAFGEAANKVLENILSNLLFHAAFDDLFDKLQTSLTEDFVNGGIGDITDTLGNFFESAKGIIPVFNASLDAVNEMAKKYGFDTFGKSTDASKNKNTMSGALSAASQESIDLLGGHTMGMRVAQLKTNDILTWGFADGLEVANRSLDNLVKIEKNTYNTVQELKALNTKIQSGSDIALAMGGV